MVTIVSLWLPIVVSAVVVFIGSSIMHMVLTHHRNDTGKLPNEDALLEAMRKEGVRPGYYAFPRPPSQKDMCTPEMVEKYNKGPVGVMAVIPNGTPAMGKYLGQWFAFCLVISVFVAYLTGRTVSAGTEYLSVFRVAGTAAFLAYGMADPVDSIWKGQPWGVTVKHMIDGLVYALLTAGTFGWLWPR
jgi:hypothetical protein